MKRNWVFYLSVYVVSCIAAAWLHGIVHPRHIEYDVAGWMGSAVPPSIAGWLLIKRNKEWFVVWTVVAFLLFLEWFAHHPNVFG